MVPSDNKSEKLFKELKMNQLDNTTQFALSKMLLTNILYWLIHPHIHNAIIMDGYKKDPQALQHSEVPS